MGIYALGHDFHLHGGEEMICHRCDFVIWMSPTPAEAACAVQMLGGGQCPASADTLPKGQDAQQGLAGTESGAVPEGQTPNPQHTSGEHNHG